MKLYFVALALCVAGAIAHFPPPPPPPRFPHPAFGIYQAEAGMEDSFDRKRPDFHDYTFTTYVPAEHHFTQIYNHSIRKRSVCIESGFYGTIEGYRNRVHQAVHPCLYGRISASEDGKKLIVESARGRPGKTFAAITTLGPVTLLQNTLEIKLETDTYTPYESISICQDGKLCAISALLNKTVVLAPVKEVYSDPLTMVSDQSITIEPDLGNVYIIRVTNSSLISDDLRVNTTVIIKLVVAAVDDGRISFEWGILYGDSRFKRNFDFLFDSSSDSSEHEHHRDEPHVRGERSSTRGAAITALIFSLFCIIAIVALFLIQFKDKIPFRTGFSSI